MSIANEIALAINARLQGILTASGYETNIGARVLRGRRRLGPEHLPCAVLIERDDDILDQSRTGDVKLAQKYVVEGHAECDPDNPNDYGHKLVSDIKRALFTGKFRVESIPQVLRLKYAGRSIAPRDEGVNLVAVSVHITVEYVEDLASP